MAQIIRDDETIEITGTFEEVIDRAFAEAKLATNHAVAILTPEHRFHIKSWASADDGNKIAYGWVRNHHKEAASRIERLLQEPFPDVRAWVGGRDKIRIAYLLNKKSDGLTLDEARQYIELLKGGFFGRWSERARK